MSEHNLPPTLKSREYKVMVDHLRFDQAEQAVADFWSEIKSLAESLGFSTDGELKLDKERSITFFDTPDHSFRRNGLVLRQRRKANGNTQYTLKSRSPDRYIAQGANVAEDPEILKIERVEIKKKLEDDISVPFISRFSLSNTLKFKRDHLPPFGEQPKTVEDCATLFSVLKKLTANGVELPLATSVIPVNNLTAYERVFAEGFVDFATSKATKTEVALILWSLGEKGRPLVAEFSFKYRDENGDFERDVAISAKRFFERVQTMDWILLSGKTKTRYVYGD